VTENPNWAGRVPQMVECLPSKHEALSSNPNTEEEGGGGRKGGKEGKERRVKRRGKGEERMGRGEKK
jgi:hypothetical protein